MRLTRHSVSVRPSARACKSCTRGASLSFGTVPMLLRRSLNVKPVTGLCANHTTTLLASRKFFYACDLRGGRIEADFFG